MPRTISVRLAAACALVAVLSLSIATGAAAKGFSADLRVVGAGGKILAEKTVTTSNVSVKSSPKALCFGEGSGGSGKAVSIKGNTGLGLLAKGAKGSAALNPLLISDSFDFGLALCGVGKSVAKGESSWHMKINHKGTQVSGDAAKIKAGDEVLWTLAPSFPYPDELAVVAPAKAQAGQAFTVRVYSYDEKGKRKPAAGVKVSGAAATTDSAGRASVTLSKPRWLLATKGDLVPDRAAVCVGGKCPAGS